jgi:hypothetical protein
VRRGSAYYSPNIGPREQSGQNWKVFQNPPLDDHEAGDIKECAVNRERVLIAKNQMAAVDGNESAKVEDLRRERVESAQPC